MAKSFAVPGMAEIGASRQGTAGSLFNSKAASVCTTAEKPMLLTTKGAAFTQQAVRKHPYNITVHQSERSVVQSLTMTLPV